MITLLDGIMIAMIALVVGTYVGFLVRLMVYEKILRPLFVFISTFVFTFRMFLLLIMPIITIVLVLFDKSIRENTDNLPPLKHWALHAFIIILSPFIGVRYVIRNIPRVYNELFPTLHSIQKNWSRVWKFIVITSTFKDLKDDQTRNMNNLKMKLVHQN